MFTLLQDYMTARLDMIFVDHMMAVFGSGLLALHVQCSR